MNAVEPSHRLRRAWIVGVGVVFLLAVALAAEIVSTRDVRRSVAAYTALIAAANRQDLAAAGRLCTQRYLAAHPLRPAAEGGIVGLPRNIHKNFQAWRHGKDIWICPTDRVGPIYRFVDESGAWRFDGPAGILRARGEVVPAGELGADE
jgi:hypothetical protein